MFLRYLPKLLFASIALFGAWVYFLVTKRNHDKTLTILAVLHTGTNGKLMRMLRRVESCLCKKRNVMRVDVNAQKLFGQETFAQTSGQVAYSIMRDGYCGYHKNLTPRVIEQILLAEKTWAGTGVGLLNEKYPSLSCTTASSNNKIQRIDYDEDLLHENELIMRLARSSAFLEVSSQVFGVQSRLDTVKCFRTFTSAKKNFTALSASAQAFHFDLDRVNWLKVFVYLSDIKRLEDGPHQYVTNSRVNKYLSACANGYERVPDDKIVGTFGADKVKSIYGERGSIFFADTLSLHKGAEVISRDRLVLEFQYSVSEFGATYKQIS